jgi:hypothetical protein
MNMASRQATSTLRHMNRQVPACDLGSAGSEVKADLMTLLAERLDLASGDSMGNPMEVGTTGAGGSLPKWQV